MAWWGLSPTSSSSRLSLIELDEEDRYGWYESGPRVSVYSLTDLVLAWLRAAWEFASP